MYIWWAARLYNMLHANKWHNSWTVQDLLWFHEDISSDDNSLLFTVWSYNSLLKAFKFVEANSHWVAHAYTWSFWTTLTACSRFENILLAELREPERIIAANDLFEELEAGSSHSPKSIHEAADLKKRLLSGMDQSATDVPEATRRIEKVTEHWPYTYCSYFLRNLQCKTVRIHSELLHLSGSIWRDHIFLHLMLHPAALQNMYLATAKHQHDLAALRQLRQLH